MNSQPNAGSATGPAGSIGVNRSQTNPYQVDTAALRAFLKRTDNAVENKPIVNRFSPHSVGVLVAG